MSTELIFAGLQGLLLGAAMMIAWPEWRFGRQVLLTLIVIIILRINPLIVP